jgi:hypothetical protein
MSVNSITNDVAALALQSLHTAAVDKSAKATPATNDQLSLRQVEHASTVDSNAKDSPAKKPLPDAGNASQNKPVRAMSHVVETYNLQGKVRIKFMDSNNNVIYQIPSEMVTKIEDQMMKPETSTTIKG